jgi:tetratricopeptide (TPR) repeat protein
MSSSDDESHMSSNDEMTQDDRCWDGNWLAGGLNLMFVGLNSDEFCQNQMTEFLEEKDEATIGGVLQEEHEFLTLPLDGDEDAWAKMHIRILRPRKLHLAGGAIRSFTDGTCPPRIRIRKLDSEEMEELLEHKKLGNQAFSSKEFEKAIEHYDDALIVVLLDMFVAPVEQINTIVSVLSNKAECELRLKRYKDAGCTATHALMFDNDHEKSRLRRAKAELAMAGLPYLVQAQVDLQEIVENLYSKAGVKEAKELLNQLDEILDMEKKSKLNQDPDFDYYFYVRMLKSKCW